jgi:hypothetical protein
MFFTLSGKGSNSYVENLSGGHLVIIGQHPQYVVMVNVGSYPTKNSNFKIVPNFKIRPFLVKCVERV